MGGYGNCPYAGVIRDASEEDLVVRGSPPLQGERIARDWPTGLSALCAAGWVGVGEGGQVSSSNAFQGGGLRSAAGFPRGLASSTSVPQIPHAFLPSFLQR